MKTAFVKLVCFPVLLVSVSGWAQKNDENKKYKEEANATRKEVWGWNKPEFGVSIIPAEFANASRIVIAKHMEVKTGSKKIITGRVFDIGMNQFFLTETVRQRIKINDKAAVTDFSEIDFRKLIDANGFRFGISANLFAGVRIIKPDGTVREVEVDEAILAPDNRKVAVPDLQAGDIIDYFLVKRRILGDDEVSDTYRYTSSYTFTMIDDDPILFSSIHIETGKRFSVEYRYYNGAPDFKRSTNADGDNIFDLVVKNIPAAAETGMWVSPFRQYPMVRMNVMIAGKDTKSGNVRTREAGKVYVNPPAEEIIEEEKNNISDIKNYEMRTGGAIKGISSALGDNISKYYFKVLKNMDKMPFDSAVAEMYYLFRYASFLTVPVFSDIKEVMNWTGRTFDPNRQLYAFASLLRSKDTECELALVPSHSGPQMTELLGPDDINWMVLAKGDKDKLFGMSNIFSPAFYVPYDYEDDKQVITAGIVGRKKQYQGTTIDIPGSSSLQNARIETLQLTAASNGADLEVSRHTVLKGYYKADVQKKLILFEDYCNAERKLFEAEKSITDELVARGAKSYSAELKTAFDNERTKQKDKFTDEAKEWFDQPITDLTDYKVENLGVRHNNPDFVYSSKFNMSGLIKKAGNNLIVDIGKLQGSPLNITTAQRKRKLDIYMPFARSLQTQITFQIPDGYAAEGINELNKKVENETGYFIAEATSDGKTVTINVKKSYNHAFEPVGNWEKMLAFIDAANEWSNAKILLKKK